MNLNEMIKGFNKDGMKNVETVVKHIGGAPTVVSLSEKKQVKRICVLILSDKWSSVNEWLSDEVLKVLLCPTSLYERMDDLIRSGYSMIEYFENYQSGAVEYMALELNRKYNFTHVVCLGEEDIIRCARIRKNLGLNNGQDIVSSLRYRDKIVMKDALKYHSIRVPDHYACVENVFDIVSFTDKYGYPVVVKPRKGYGSVNTSILYNEEDRLKLFSLFSFSQDIPLDLEIEAFVNGPMYHVDGFIHQGVLRLCYPSIYVNLCIDYTTEKYNASYSLSPDNTLVPRLQEYVKSVVESLDAVTSYPFHAEVWHTPEDELILCEIASRVGGAGIRYSIRELFDMNLDRLWVQTQAEDFVDKILDDVEYQDRVPKHQSCGWIIIFPNEGTLIEVPKNCNLDFVTRYDPIGTENKTYGKTQHSADSVAQFIVKGDSEEDCKDNLLKCLDWWNETSKWE